MIFLGSASLVMFIEKDVQYFFSFAEIFKQTK